tara:strand:- start:662 stop:1120 length:459 start_codon:yes stop_codon:yes gene_type:complete
MLINMILEQRISQDIKDAMLGKNTIKLEVCRSIKSAILLAKTEKGLDLLGREKEIQILQKLFKQREESKKIYLTQNRLDLAKAEEEQALIISEYLPKPYTEQELEDLIDDEIVELGVSSKKDMGRLISSVVKKAQGKADGQTISSIIKKKLN